MQRATNPLSQLKNLGTKTYIMTEWSVSGRRKTKIAAIMEVGSEYIFLGRLAMLCM